jgi:hypothetical protein
MTWGQATIILTKREAFLKLGSKSAFCAHETQYLQNNCLNLSNCPSSSAEKRNMK